MDHDNNNISTIYLYDKQLRSRHPHSCLGQKNEKIEISTVFNTNVSKLKTIINFYDLIFNLPSIPVGWDSRVGWLGGDSKKKKKREYIDITGQN